MNSFLAEFVTELLQKHEILEKLTLVLPSKRACVVINQELIKQIAVPKYAPEIYSIEEFIELLAPQQLSSSNEQLFLLYQAYISTIPKSSQESFERFIEWAPRLLKDFSDVDAYLLDSKHVFQTLGEYYRLEHILDSDLSSQNNRLLWDSLPELYKKFQALISHKQAGTIGMLYREALAGIEIFLDYSENYHYFIGFNALNKAEQLLFQSFLTDNKGEVIWDLSFVLYKNKVHAAGRFIRSYQEQWTHYRRNPYSFDKEEEEKEIHLIGTPGHHAQARQVSELLQTLDVNKSTAIILGDENLLEPVLSFLPKEIENWNVTMGFPIAQTPLVRFFKDFFELHQSKDKDYPSQLVDRILEFSLVKKQRLAASVKHRSEHKKTFIFFQEDLSAKEKKRLMAHPMGMLLFSQLNTGMDAIIRALQIVDFFTEKTKQLKLDEYDNTLFEGVREVLKSLHQIANESDFSFSVKATLELFNETIKQQKIDFLGDPVQGIQIMGMLESRILDFEQIIITHLNEGILPVGKNDQSFFPFSLKKQFGLPTFLDNDAIYTYHFYRLLQRAKSVYLLYNSKSEGLGAGEKSRFIQQLQLIKDPKHTIVEKEIQPTVVLPPIKPVEVIKSKAMLAKLLQLAKKGFSPTSLSSYLVDPIGFYNTYLLGIKDDPPIGSSMNSLVRGTLVHKALELLYQPYLGELLTTEKCQLMQERTPGLLLKNYKELHLFSPAPKGENYLILSAYTRAIIQLIEIEKNLIIQGNQIQIIALEESFCQPFIVKEINFPIQLRGTIDRVDRFNGKLRIIDYKTGGVTKEKLSWANWDQFKGDFNFQPLFQLIIYAWAVREKAVVDEPIELGIISLKYPNFYVQNPSIKKSKTSSSLELLDNEFLSNFTIFLKHKILELFDLNNSFVSLKED